MGEFEIRNGILDSAIRQSIKKLAERGVEGCTTKDVILASFAALSFDGGVASSKEVKRISTEIRKFGWKIAGMCFTTLLAIICVLIFL